MHEDRQRHERYSKASLSLTALGTAILARADDFSRHNPIHRWWGGTELTNDRLWRWDQANRRLDRAVTARLLRRLCVVRDRRAGADEVAVAIDVVDAADRAPVFVGA